jgi:predicted nucleic acid-binding Zn ribbon protein
MPVYVYETVRADGKPGRRFQIFQKITAPALKKDPRTSESVRRVILPVAVLGNRFDRASKQIGRQKAAAEEAKTSRKLKKKK